MKKKQNFNKNKKQLKKNIIKLNLQNDNKVNFVKYKKVNFVFKTRNKKKDTFSQQKKKDLVFNFIRKKKFFQEQKNFSKKKNNNYRFKNKVFQLRKKNRKFFNSYKNFFNTQEDAVIKRRFPKSFQLLKFFPSVSYKYKLYWFKRRKKKEFKATRKQFTYRAVLLRFVNAFIRKRKRKKRWKNRIILRWLYRNNKKKKFFKKLKILQKTFMQYYGNISYYNFKRVHLWYSIYNNLTKFEKFFNYFEFRLPTIVVRIKFVRNYYHAVKFVNFGGIRVNGLQISYTNFVTKICDLIELAYRFFRYGYSKKYIKFKKYRHRIYRRAKYLRFYTKKYRMVVKRWFLKKRANYRGKKRTYFKYRSNRFFEKNRRIVSVILLRSLYKYKHRKFNKYFNFRNLSLLMSFIKK